MTRDNFFLSRLCVSSLIWKGRPAGEIAQSMMRLGLAHLELAARSSNSGHAAADEDSGAYVPGGANSRLFNLFAEAGVRVAALRIAGLSRDEKIDAIEDAGRRGIPAVIDHVERVNFPDMVSRVRDYAGLAALAGVRYALENDNDTSCENSLAQLTLADAVRHPALGFAFEPRAALEDRKDSAVEVGALGEKLQFAALWSAPVSEESMNGGVAPISGLPRTNPLAALDPRAIDWAAYFEALNAARFRGAFVLRWRGDGKSDARRIERAIAMSVLFYRRMAEVAGFGVANLPEG